MRKLYKKNIFIFAVFCLTVFNFDGIMVYAASGKSVEAVQKTAVYTSVSPLDVVNNPDKYLNKNIKFTAEFAAFTSLGLDYEPAFREGSKYIGILIKRPDVDNHTIPLSEMKIFINRELAEKNADIESGDKIELSGKVFSNALGDPWIDAESIKMINTKSEK